VVPEEVAGVHVAVPADECAAILYEVAALFLPGGRLGEPQLQAHLPCHLLCLGKDLVQLDAAHVVETEEALQVEGDPPLHRVGLHGRDEGDDPLFLRGAIVFPENVRIPADVDAGHLGLVLPDMEEGEGLVGAEVVGALTSMGFVVGEQMGDDGKRCLVLRRPAQGGRQLPQVVLHDDKFYPYLQFRPPAEGFGLCHGAHGVVDACQFASAADRADRVGRGAVNGETDPVEPGIGKGYCPQGGEQQAVALEADPAPRRHE